MSLRPRVRTATLLVLFAVASCGRTVLPPQGHDRPRVARVEPGDELERPEQALALHFDRAMVGAEAVGPVLEAAPVAVAPSTPLRVHWQDRQTLVVEPEGEWKVGQRYVLQLTAAELAPEARDVTFDVLPLRLESVDLPREIVPRRPEFEAVFSLPVDPAEVQRRCALQDSAGKRTALAARASPTEDPARVALVASETLALATRYVLDCRELTPAGGGASWRPQREVSSFTTHGLLELSWGQPRSGSALPPEKATVCLALTTPVDDEQLVKHVRVTPAPPAAFDTGWYYNSCDTEQYRVADRTNAVRLAPRTRYRITVGADLTDTFGQRLGREHSWEFQTDDRIPGLWTATGIGRVLEAGRGEHAAGALNLSAAELRCVAVTPAQFAAQSQGLQQWVYGAQAYAPHRDDEDGEGLDAQPPAAAPWQLLGIAPRQQLLEAVAPPNAARRLPLDVGASCATASGLPGVYALELAPQAGSRAPYDYQGDVPARLLANVTDLGVVAKRGASTALAWVTRLSNGAVVPGAKVELLDGAGKRVAAGQTDATGLLWLPKLPAAVQGEVFAVRAGDDVAIVGTDWNWSDGLRPWQLDVREAVDASVLMFVHTDRGVYRPGERVYVHGLVFRSRTFFLIFSAGSDLC